MTLDAFFATDADYEQAAASGVLTKDTIARLYQVDPATVALYRLPDIRVIKASFPRPVVQGSLADRDMALGSTTHPPGRPAHHDAPRALNQTQCRAGLRTEIAAR